MPRVPYRRISPRHDTPHHEPGAPGETLILQSVLSGVILVVVMVITLVSVPQTAALRDGFGLALSGPTTLGEVVYATRQQAATLTGWEWLAPPTPAGEDAPIPPGAFYYPTVPMYPLYVPHPPFIPVAPLP